MAKKTFTRIESIASSPHRIVVTGDTGTWLCIYPGYAWNNVTFSQELVCVFTTKSYDDVMKEINKVIESDNIFDSAHLML